MVSKAINDYLSQIHELEKKSIAIKRELVQSNSLASIHQKDGNKLSFALFQIQDKTIAVPVLFVTEIVNIVKLIPTADTIAGVAGLVNYRGEMYSVVDIGELIGLSKSAISVENYLAICQLESFRFALLVNDVIGLATVQTNDIKIEEEILAGALKLMGIVQYAGQTALIIDVWSILYSIHINSFQDIRTTLIGSTSESEHQGEDNTT